MISSAKKHRRKICLLLFTTKKCMVGELFTTQSQLLTAERKKALKKTVGKGENAGNQHFLLFS